MRGLLARFFRDHRGGRVGWSDLRAALAGAGPEARRILDQWERPGIPTIVVECASRRAGSSWVVEGKLSQEGTEKPFSMDVSLVAECKGKPVTSVVRLTGTAAPFTLKAPAEPGAVTVDPDWLVLAARKSAGSADPAKEFDEGIAVANDPGEADPGKLEEAIGKLRRVLAAGQQQGACHVGIGRCLFRQGKLDEAKEELETGLGIGGFGPFNRSWAHLRLGCIADLGRKRDEAVSHYKAVIALPDASNLKFQKGKAQTFLDRPYRGYRADG
jgi:tetratricopeptide (TPR) repeat protein